MATAEGREELEYQTDFPRLEYLYGFMVRKTLRPTPSSPDGRGRTAY